ncbi:hybrid sensor histidine kinase/response regulator [Enterobacter ludwigii]|uniref:hybrid sensor histidine kinase/response regulator n=1 Tax=Enterobacter ludwigii TaxID=299767 RepID=UPI003FD6AA6F
MKKEFHLSIIGILAVMVLSLGCIFKYNSLLSEKSLYAIAGTQENYAWAIAKFSIQLNEFLALTNNQSDLDTIHNKLDLLYSRVNIIRNQSESTNPLYQQSGYLESINAIYEELNKIDVLLNEEDPNLDYVVEELTKIKPIANNLTNLADNAEVAQRTNALKDFKQKREKLLQLLFITGFLIVVLCVMIPIYIRKLNVLLVSERVAYSNKNAFLGMVGHELRTSLQAIISVIDSIRVNNDNNIKNVHLQRLEASVTKMERQMRDIAEFARIDNDAVEVKNTYFSVKKIVHDVIQESSATHKKESVSMRFNEESDAIVYSDPFRIYQIIENLTSNAIKYTDAGFVDISFSVEKDKWLTVIITDTGRGIAKDKLKCIFKPFVRINDDKTSVPGFGMGLAIVHGLIRLLKGTINIQSELGVGTSVTVRLPVKIGSDELLPVSLPKNMFDKNLVRDTRILVVDDNQMACVALAELLKGVGYNVEYTIDPERALQKLQRKPYDVVLSDLQMPVITGDELYLAVRNGDGPNRSTPFIFISAFAEVSPIPEVTMLTKPARIEEINDEIQRVMHVEGA